MSLSRNIAHAIIDKNIPATGVVEVLQNYKLLSLLPAILSDMKRLSHDTGNRETIRVESPFEVGKDALVRIRRVVGNDLAPTEVTINKELLAGFKARYKGKLYDGSAERIIKQLTRN